MITSGKKTVTSIKSITTHYQDNQEAGKQMYSDGFQVYKWLFVLFFTAFIKTL